MGFANSFLQALSCAKRALYCPSSCLLRLISRPTTVCACLSDLLSLFFLYRPSIMTELRTFILWLNDPLQLIFGDLGGKESHLTFRAKLRGKISLPFVLKNSYICSFVNRFSCICYLNLRINNSMFSQNQLLFLLNCINMRTTSQYYTLHKHVNFASVCISILYIIGTQMAYSSELNFI